LSPEREPEGAGVPAVIPARRSWMSRRLHRFGRNGFSTQVYLIALVIALIGPGLLFTSILLMRYASAERARFEQDARENVRGIGLSLDRDTAGLVSVLQTLATSPRIRQNEFEAFDAQARLVRESIDLDVLLRRPNGQELVNTGVPRGAPLPVVPLPFDQDLARGTQRAMVSGYVPGPSPGEATYSVGVPVMVDGEVAYILSFTVPLSRLQGILSREVVPGWTTGISDRSGLVLARLPDPDAVVGRPRLASLRQVQSGTPGVWEGQDRQHKPVVVIEARSRLTGWMVATSIPQAVVDARVRRWVWAFAGFGLLVLATSSVLAVNLWSRVSRPLRLLAASGPALARGEAIPRVSSPVHEIQRLGAVLSDASVRLRTREAERDRALADTRRGLTALSESEERFRHMADSAPALIWMTDETGEVSFANLHFEHMFGTTAAALANQGWHQIIHPDDLDNFRAAFEEAFEARVSFRTEVRVIDKARAVRWLRCEGVPRLDDDHNFLGYTGCNIDITDAKNAE
jgi:PAS domain S-box-containing protein